MLQLEVQVGSNFTSFFEVPLFQSVKISPSISPLQQVFYVSSRLCPGALCTEPPNTATGAALRTTGSGSSASASCSTQGPATSMALDAANQACGQAVQELPVRRTVVLHAEEKQRQPLVDIDIVNYQGGRGTTQPPDGDAAGNGTTLTNMDVIDYPDSGSPPPYASDPVDSDEDENEDDDEHGDRSKPLTDRCDLTHFRVVFWMVVSWLQLALAGVFADKASQPFQAPHEVRVATRTDSITLAGSPDSGSIHVDVPAFAIVVPLLSGRLGPAPPVRGARDWLRGLPGQPRLWRRRAGKLAHSPTPHGRDSVHRAGPITLGWEKSARRNTHSLEHAAAVGGSGGAAMLGRNILRVARSAGVVGHGSVAVAVVDVLASHLDPHHSLGKVDAGSGGHGASRVAASKPSGRSRSRRGSPTAQDAARDDPKWKGKGTARAPFELR
ncbi:hypothetical protein BV25DRAFT_1842953 [Artomyces pyxidatus]|uniref:Uncharacterized protein n=1 Tax=Artomyces pyxidatus TaxID=48021 RepID=A0ACB8SGW4_9AGAM|nr:hypothetical protein BV25DRAFT_1842953 [Artomyces pyxidatus]